MEDKDEKIFIECDCFSEGIMLETWAEDKQLCISIWKRGIHPQKRGWSYRLKYIWQILRGKELYSDEIILNNEKSAKVRDWLNAQIKDEN